MKIIKTEFRVKFKNSIFPEFYTPTDEKSIEIIDLPEGDPMKAYEVYKKGEEDTFDDMLIYQLIKDGFILGRFTDEEKRMIHYTITTSDLSEIEKIETIERREMIHKNH